MINFLNAISDKWLTFQLAMLWQVAVLIGIVWLIDLLIRRRVWPQVRYALWLLIIIKLLIPPTLTSPVSVTSPIPAAVHKAVSIQFRSISPADAASTAKNLEISETITPPGASNKQQTSEEAFCNSPAGILSEAAATPVIEIPAAITPAQPAILSYKAYMMLAWLLGVAVLSGWLLARLSSLRKEYQSNSACPAHFESILQAAARRLGLKRLPRVIVTARVSTPAVFGLFRPVLLMPADTIKRMSARDIEHILLHELAHIKRGDLLVHAVYMVLQIIYWFNPLLWMIRRTLQNLRELCCDATVARLLREDTLHYRQTLLDTARGLLAVPVDPSLGLLGLFENSNWLVTRLAWLEKKTWKNRPLRIATVIGLVSVMTVCVLPMANRPQQPPQFQVTGTVTDAHTGAPIAGADVYDDGYNDSQCRATTDEQGHFTLMTYKEEHTIAAKADGYAPLKKTLTTWPFANHKNFDFRLDKTPHRKITDFAQIVVEEGKGFDELLVNAECTRNLIIAKLGEPDNGRTANPMRYQRHGLDFWINAQRGVLTEIRLNPGFEGRLKSGISLSSTRQEVFATYGVPLSESQWQKLTGSYGGDRVLMTAPPDMAKIFYDQLGLLFWFKGDRISQIVIFTSRAGESSHSKGKGATNAGVDIAPSDFKLQFDPKRNTYSLIVSIRNHSNAVMPKHKIRYYQDDPEKNLDETGNPHTGWHEAGPIEPGKEWNEQTRNFYVPDGEYTFTVTLDYDNEIPETNEDNNRAALQVTIRNGQIVQQTTRLVQTRTPPQNSIRFEAPFELDKNIPLTLVIGTNEQADIIKINAIRFEKRENQIVQKIDGILRPWPQTDWRFKIELLDAQGSIAGSLRYNMHNRGRSEMDTTNDFEPVTGDFAAIGPKGLIGVKQPVRFVFSIEQKPLETETLTQMYSIRGTVVDATEDWPDEFFDKLDALQSNEDEPQRELVKQMSPKPTPLAGIIVKLQGAIVSKQAVTDAEGEFVFTDLQGPTFGPYGGMSDCQIYEISADMPIKPDANGQKRELNVTRQVTLDSDKNLTLTFRRDLISIRGRIIDASGITIEGAKITATLDIDDINYDQYLETHDPQQWSAVSGSDGTYELAGIDPSNWHDVSAYLFSGRSHKYVDIEVTAEGFTQDQNNRPRVPLISEKTLSQARRFLTFAKRMAKPEDLAQMQEKEPLLPSISGTAITGIDIVLIKQASTPTQDPGQAAANGEVKLELRLAAQKEDITEQQLTLLTSQLSGLLSLENAQWVWRPLDDNVTAPDMVAVQEGGTKYILLSNQPDSCMLADGSWSIKSARAAQDEQGHASIEVSLDEAGAMRFHDLTKKSIDRQLAILIDDKVITAPRIMAALRNSAVISGAFTKEQAQQMAASLQSGTSRRFQVTDETASVADQKETPFCVYGQVIDANGSPMPGVTVRASCGWHTLMPTGSTTTDEHGRYKLYFRPGMRFKIADTDQWGVGFQAASIMAEKENFYEINLCKDGNLAMAGSEKQAAEHPYRGNFKGIVYPNQPHELNFKMAPAASIKGIVTGPDGKPLPGFQLYMTGPDLYPSSSALVNITTDETGKFSVGSVPLRQYRFEHSVDGAPALGAWITYQFPAVYHFEIVYDKSKQQLIENSSMRVPQN